MCCSTTGSYDHPLIPMMSKGDGKSFYSSPTLARLGCHFMPNNAKMVVKGDIMTANDIKKDCVTDAQADA